MIAAGGFEMEQTRFVFARDRQRGSYLQHFLVSASKQIHSLEEAVNAQSLSPSHFLLDSQIP
jgi:hypothetical protein